MATQERYILIDKDRLRFVKATPTYMQAEYWSALKCRNRDTYLCSPARRSFTAFSEMELKELWISAKGSDPAYRDYGELVAMVAAHAETMPLDDTPEEALAAKLGHTLTGLKEAGNVAGHVQEASNNRSDDLQTDRAATKVAAPQSKPTTPQESTMAKSKQKKAGNGKAAQEKRNGVARPRTGTSGEKIWQAADKHSTPKNPAAFAEVAKALKSAGIPEASLRAGYQHWRKFHGVKGRVSAE